MTLLISAMDEEIIEIKKKMKIKEEGSWLKFPYYQGYLNDSSVLLIKCGIGKVVSCMVTTHFIEAFDIKRVIFTGMAGSLNDAYQISDLIIANDCVFYDVDVRAFSYPLGQIPQIDFRFIDSDKELLNLSSDIKIENTNIHYGRVLTGDRFVTDKSSLKELNKDLQGDAVEMEGASVALVCKLHNIPFIIARVISDKADGSSPKDFKEFSKNASSLTLVFLEKLLNLLN